MQRFCLQMKMKSLMIQCTWQIVLFCLFSYTINRNIWNKSNYISSFGNSYDAMVAYQSLASVSGSISEQILCGHRHTLEPSTRHSCMRKVPRGIQDRPSGPAPIKSGCLSLPLTDGDDILDVKARLCRQYRRRLIRFLSHPSMYNWPMVKVQPIRFPMKKTADQNNSTVRSPI
jgi:hypothetical protein